MKRFVVILLFISIGFNAFFIKLNMQRKQRKEIKKSLDFWKDISHKEGYKFFENKMKKDYPDTEFKEKNSIVYFWDSTSFDFRHINAMRQLDSLVTSLGEYTFNYIFATEMDQNSANDFLTRNGVKYKNFKVLGGMDDFISGVYNEKPVKWKRIGPRLDSTKLNPNCPDMTKKKVKGYYFLMDTKGEITYHNYKYLYPTQDTSLLKLLNTASPVKNLKILD